MAGLEENYCRNPDQDKHGPWCFTNNSAIHWDYCNVKPCKCNDVRTRGCARIFLLPIILTDRLNKNLS